MSQTLPSPLGSSIFYPPDKTGKKKPRSYQRGWLRRQGGLVKSWQQRWFTLQGQCVFYYANEDETRSHIGSIFLPGCRVVELAQQPTEPDKFMFTIEPDGEKGKSLTGNDSHTLCAASDTERKAWILAIRKVLYAEKGGAVFGQKLEETMAYQRKWNRRQVPDIVECCVNFLVRHGLETEGLFRLPGRSSLVRRLRQEFDCGERPVLLPPDVDVHSVASLLKQFLRELPEPLVPLHLYERVMQLCTRDVCERRSLALSGVRDTLVCMHTATHALLAYISKFLHQVAMHSEANRMTTANLATVFVHAFIRPELDDPVLLMGTSESRGQAVLVFITCAEYIFGNTAEMPEADELAKMELNASEAQNSNGGSGGDKCQPHTVQWPVAVEKLVDVDADPELERDEKTCLSAGRNSVNRRRTRPASSTGTPLAPPRQRRNVHASLRPAKSVSNVAANGTDLLCVDTSSWSAPELRTHIEELNKEIVLLREANVNLKGQLAMASRSSEVQNEKNATAEAVNKIVELQDTLQQYQLKYGPL